ncbi:MAG: hypothetical protein P4L52_00925 [Acidocella sp.]|nr:hypothetical protein [Acidocella sp.]
MAAGLFLSLKIVFGANGTDADSIFSMTLWQGVQAHGAGWIRYFLFTPDNWLLSVVPFNFLSFELFGMRAWLVVVSGWVVFVLAALVCALLAHELGARRWALLAPMPLLLMGWYAQRLGFVAYPTSHDVTSMYGLAALLCAIRGIRTGGWGYFALVAWLLAAGSVSDPWMMTAYDLPLLLYCALAGLRPSPTARAMRWLAVLALAAILLVRTHVLWTMRFLPSASVHLASPQMRAANFSYLVKDLGGLLNIVPTERMNDMLPALLSLAGAGVAGLAAWRAARQAGMMEEAVPRFFVSIACLSTLLTVACFVLLNITQGDYSGRFLINVLYLFITFVVVAMARGWRQMGWWQKSATGLFMGLFLVCGLVTTSPIWSAPGFAMQTNGVEGIIGLLQANGLTYGYGPYHGARANAVTAMSNGRIVIRPVTFDPKTGWLRPQLSHAATAPVWLTAQDVPPGQREFFVYVASDGEECPDPALCIAGLTAQFGPPERRLENGAASILVWGHPLLAAP